MSEPSSALGFEDLILRVAREAGIAYHGSEGDERAMVPIDEHDLDLCKTIVNDGIRMFIADAPVKGWRWMRRIMSVTLTATRITGTVDAADVDDDNPVTSPTLTDATLETTYDTDDDLVGYWIYILTGTGKGSYAQITDYTASGGVVEVADWLDENGNLSGTYPVKDDTFAITPVETINGDIARYPLAENFGGEVNGPIRYASSTNHSSIIEWTDEAFIRAKRSVTVITGYPLLAAIRPYEPVSSAPSPKRRFELIVDPQPSAADILQFPYTLFFDSLRLETGDASSVSGSTGLLDDALDSLYPDDYFNGWVIKIVSGTGKNSYALVSDYTGGTAQFDVLDWLNIDGSAGGVDPAANSVYVVQPPNNLHPAGFRFDEVIKAACLAQAEMDIEDINAGWTNKYVQQALQKATMADTRSAPRKLGSMDAQKRWHRERVWDNITNDNDL